MTAKTPNHDTDPNPPASPPAAVLPVPAEPPADAAPDDGRSVFVVTPRAGPRVAGQRVKAQQKIRLTEDEALSELLTGAIVREGGKLHDALRADAKPRASKAG